MFIVIKWDPKIDSYTRTEYESMDVFAKRFRYLNGIMKHHLVDDCKNHGGMYITYESDFGGWLFHYDLIELKKAYYGTNY
ncbi:hypothetical protein YenMTG1_198 [Yersinia phage vB_YenM_TG1]|uniref:Uncharacterized protein n=1 Tax=Yersinia phage vB_YenM_TG1 TaxID=1589265 RepID=A0A0B4ZZM8_9CAUD|nr:hypothetical protein AVV33_gp197 [Yersinia phage vB_YenM_TG1]AJD82008.1 hypothetical protein YenMTG1_198 [Yersinia phage vB_YenM_TG1]